MLIPPALFPTLARTSVVTIAKLTEPLTVCERETGEEVGHWGWTLLQHRLRVQKMDDQGRPLPRLQRKWPLRGYVLPADGSVGRIGSGGTKSDDGLWVTWPSYAAYIEGLGREATRTLEQSGHMLGQKDIYIRRGKVGEVKITMRLLGAGGSMATAKARNTQTQISKHRHAERKRLSAALKRDEAKRAAKRTDTPVSGPNGTGGRFGGLLKRRVAPDDMLPRGKRNDPNSGARVKKWRAAVRARLAARIKPKPLKLKPISARQKAMAQFRGKGWWQWLILSRDEIGTIGERIRTKVIYQLDRKVQTVSV